MITPEEYVERFANRVARHYGHERPNKYAVAMAKGAVHAALCDPEGDAVLDIQELEETRDPITVLTETYHRELRILIERELTKEPEE